MDIIYHHIDAMALAKSLNCPVVHGCNAQGVMGSGFAAMIRTQYPEAEQVYLDAYRTTGLALGSFTFADSNGALIINLVTQEFTSRARRMTSYDAIANGFYDLNQVLSQHGMQNLVMPAIGADLGGGSWKIISSIIETEMTAVQPHVCYLDKQVWARISAS